MKISFAIFPVSHDHDYKEMEEVMQYISDVIKKFREAKDQQPLLISEVNVEKLKDNVMI